MQYGSLVFLLFFNIDFTMSNLTVSSPVLEWHLHVAFIVAFCNLKTVFLSPMTLASLGRRFWCPELLPQASSCLLCLFRQSNTNVGLESSLYALGHTYSKSVLFLNNHNENQCQIFPWCWHTTELYIGFPFLEQFFTNLDLFKLLWCMIWWNVWSRRKLWIECQMPASFL